MDSQDITRSRLCRKTYIRPLLRLNGVVTSTQLFLLDLRMHQQYFLIVVFAAFKEFIHNFLEVYLDDWKIFSLLKDHVEMLCLMLDWCMKYHISLNLKK
jgi:hypothetical protein